MFTFKLELEDGTPADPPTLDRRGTELEGRRHDLSAVGDLRVVEVREAVPVAHMQRAQGSGERPGPRLLKPLLESDPRWEIRLACSTLGERSTSCPRGPEAKPKRTKM